MATHRAWVQQELGGKLELQQVQTPEPSVGQILVEVLATPLLSYTDAVVRGQLFPLVYPLTPGVSCIGRIASTGPDSATLKAGQLVFTNPVIRARDDPDGASILHGWMPGVSPEARKLMEGPWRNGAWAEKMLVPTENVVPLDERRLRDELGYSVSDLCWISDLLIPFGGWLAADLAPGSTVIVAPATGHFGASAVQTALAFSVKTVIAAGRNTEALRKIQQSAPPNRVKTVQLTGDVDQDSSSIREATGGAGADAYLDFSPFQASGATHPSACVNALRPGGKAILMGGIPDSISFNYFQLMMNNITIKGNFMYTPDAPARLVALLEAGVLDLKQLNTTVAGFENLHKGIELAGEHSGIFSLTALAIEHAAGSDDGTRSVHSVPPT